MTDKKKLEIHNLNLEAEGRVIFKKLKLQAFSGDKVIIVGENGVGKSTLLKAIKDFSHAFSDSIKASGTNGYLPQSFEDVPKRNVFEHLIAETNDSKLIELLNSKETSDTNLWKRQFNSLGGYRLIKTFSQLKLGQEMLDREFASLSGGEKTKIHLASLIFQNPDILLLDEPTNHLDEVGLNWLEKFLKDYHGILIMVTHDRYLINQTANYISELSPETHKLTHFHGNYQNYLREKEREYQRLKQIREQQEKEIKLTNKKIDDLHIKNAAYKPKRRDNFKMAFNFHKQRNQKHQKRIVNQLKNKRTDLVENLVEVPLLIRRKLEIDLSIKDNSLQGNDTIIELKNISKSYKNNEENKKTIIFQGLSLELKKQDKLVIKGANGSGKSTLLKIIMGLIKADSGNVTIQENAKLGFLDQEQETLNLEQTVIELLKTDSLIKLEETEIYEKLQEFGIFYPQELLLPLSKLSIGCRRKTQLVQIILRGSNVLILDEPTNHFDLPSLEKIEEQLMKFPGSILAASHDRYFIQKVCNRTINIEEFKTK